MSAGTVPATRPVPAAAGRPRAAQVSVIMCIDAQHGLDLLREAVPSVLGQTHEDLVLRIFLDGPVSDDVRRYLEGLVDSRVSIERAETHQGRAVGLNRLIDESLRAGSDLIARMSADGACHPERLAKQLAFLARHPEVAVLGAGCVALDERTGKESLEVPPADDWTLKRGLIRRPPFVPSTVVFRADVFRGGTRYRTLAWEDMHLWVDLTRYGWLFANLQEPLLRCRASDRLFRPGSGPSPAVIELRARIRGMTELCMLTPGNITWAGTHFGLGLLPPRLARRAGRYLRLPGALP